MEFRIFSDQLTITSTGGGQVIDWGVSMTQAPMLWKTTKGQGVKVAVLDTGVDHSHVDLARSVAMSVNFTSPNTGDGMDRQGHGTHCAGVIAGSDNGVGVIGVAPEAKIYSAKVLGDNGSGSIKAIIDGIDFAIRQGVDIISMSLGTDQNPGPQLHDAIKRAHAAGIILVAASGNEASACCYPAAYPEVIAVGAMDQALDKAKFSNFGPEVDIAAGGVDILSTYPGGRYAKLSGTSMATPLVAGVIALIVSATRQSGIKLTPQMVMSLIAQRSVDLGQDGQDHDYGHGMINVYKLIKKYN